MDNKFCMSCGESLSLTSMFCHSCGQKQTQSNQNNNKNNSKPATNNRNNKHNKNKKKNKPTIKQDVLTDTLEDGTLDDIIAALLPSQASIQAEKESKLKKQKQLEFDNEKKAQKKEPVASAPVLKEEPIVDNPALEEKPAADTQIQKDVPNVKDFSLEETTPVADAVQEGIDVTSIEDADSVSAEQPIDNIAAPSIAEIIAEEKQSLAVAGLDEALFHIKNTRLAGYKAIILGSEGTKKEDFLDNVTSMLFENGKIQENKATIINFGDIPKRFNNKELYIVNDLQAAIANLFNLEDFSDNATHQQQLFQEKMETLINADKDAYILLDSTTAEIKGFMPLDARLSYIFSNRISFPDLTISEILSIYTDNIPETHSAQLDDEFKILLMEYLSRNIRFFPFKNRDLAMFLVDYTTREEILTLPDEKFNPSTLTETFSKIIGMENVKAQVHELNDYLNARNQLTDAGASLPDFNMHMMFLGNPGVGKTSIARIISKTLFDLGYCREDKLVEVTSKDLIGAYGNQTGIKTNRAIMRALGGVLFIDEAYSLSNSCGQAGAEAIAIIIKAMIDYQDDLIVMFAGYSMEMRTFVDSNSGIASRINYIFKFEDYTKEELFSILELKMGFIGITLDPGAIHKVEQLCKFASGRKNAGNGRFIDNLIQKMLTKHATQEFTDFQDKLCIGRNSIPSVEDIMSTTSF